MPNLVRTAFVASVLLLSACARLVPFGAGTPAPQVGPPAGTVVVVGGGAVGPEILTRFIEAAGGPNALIIDVPTAGGAATYPEDWRGMNQLKAAGARNVRILHTKDKKVADSDAFTAILAKAGGVWFEGGRQWQLVDSYAGTKSERGFHDVLARGGVVGGSSAGASILSSYMLRGARSGNDIIMAPGYEVGFGFLRNVAIDQHVVARERLPDLADSLLPRRPELLGISEDEGTAWFIKGDVAEIVGRNKAFVYGGKDATDARKPFLTLYPGDRYDLAARRVIRRAVEDSPLTHAFIDSLFGGIGGKATVLVAQAGKVLADRAYGIPDHPRYQPGTTVPNFRLGDLANPLNALMGQIAGAGGKPAFGARYPAQVNTRLFTPIGAHWTTVDSTGTFASNVDELYRFSMGLDSPRTFANDTTGSPTARLVRDETAGWLVDSYRGMPRWSAYANQAGKRNAFVRLPQQQVSVIVLTDREELDARAVVDRILDRLMPR